MIKSQTDLFCLVLSNSPKAAAFWQHKMLPLSAAAADLSKKHCVPFFTIVADLQALRRLLGPEDDHMTLEDVFEEAMDQHEELNLPCPSADMLAFGRLHL
jgi:hypothetical protein